MKLSKIPGWAWLLLAAITPVLLFGDTAPGLAAALMIIILIGGGVMWMRPRYLRVKKKADDLSRARAMKSHQKSPQRKRKPIPQDVKDAVWRRDEGRCAQCGSQHSLEFDHIIPHAKGGADTYRNLQLLCQDCNRSKSAKIG